MSPFQVRSGLGRAVPDGLGGCRALGPSQPLKVTPPLPQVLLPVPREVHAFGDCTDGGARAELSGCAVGGCRV
eukprot:4049814-Pyramimonas_sp.AAC.1